MFGKSKASPSPGVYSDGGGLYLRVRPQGSKSWLFIATINGARREFGLGSGIDIPLARARERALTIRTAIDEGREPRFREPKAPAAEIQKALAFGEFADALIDDIESGFRNAKHRKQWRATLKTHAAAILTIPVADVSTDNIVAVLKPIWARQGGDCIACSRSNRAGARCGKSKGTSVW